MVRTFPEFGYDPVTGEWNDSLTGEFLWSNVNLSEAVPDVMTPSTWSLWWIFHCETNPIQFPGNAPFCGNISGRPYFNLSLLYSVYKAVGKDTNKEMRRDMMGTISDEIDIPIIPFSALLIYRTVLPGTFQARWLIRRCQEDMPRFLENTPSWCRATRLKIAHWTTPQSLVTGWREVIKPVMVQGCQMLRTVTTMLQGPATRLRLELADLVGEADANAILSNLSGEGSLASLGPLLGLSEVVNGRLSQDDYLERYGHRGPHEMELSAPGAEEDPKWMENQLAQFRLRHAEVDVLLAQQRTEQAAAWERFRVRYPKRVREVRTRLDQVAKAAQAREAVRSEVTRLARLLRAFLLQAGAVSGFGEDVFFLTLDESLKVLAGDKTAISRIPARQRAYERACTLPSYPAIIIGYFDPFAWAADPNRRNDFYDTRHPTTGYASGILHGSSGAAGVVEGIVRRLDQPEDGDQLQVGEILVAVTTNIGWTLLFPRLAAVVTDIGAPLSHAAIVARELGIPAVVGCGNATMLLKTGDRVRVDGGAGTVTIL
jgi:pyruvate,water dikinase